MSSSDAVEKLLNGIADKRVVDVNAGDDLRDDLEPDVDADGRRAIGDCEIDGLVVAVLEPERHQTEGVLERVAPRECD